MIKQPPHSVEAEQAVLSAIIERNSLIDDLESLLSAERFYRHEHQIIWKRMQAMALLCQPIDAVTLTSYLEAAGDLEVVGGSDYIVDLAMQSRGAANAMHYAELIRDRWLSRVLIQKGQDIIQSGYDSESVQDAINEAQANILNISKDNAGEPKHVDQAMLDAVNHLTYVSKLTGEIIGVSTGFADLDKITSGLNKGDLVIIAGRPSMGKTTLAMNIAENAARKDEFVIVFSLEMPSQQLMMRSMSSLGGVKFDLIKKAKDDSIWSGITSAVHMMRQKPYYIDDNPVLTSEQLLSRARKLARQVGRTPDLIVVDYIQLLSDKGDNGNERITKISRNLKLTAKSLDCPLVALSQLNRKCEERGNSRPIMSDLRESGAIEQDADIIGFVYRDEIYDPNTTQKGVAELLIRKNRNGEIGTVYLAAQLDMCRFKDLINYNPPAVSTRQKKSRQDYE